MPTETGMEEFIFVVKDGRAMTMERGDTDSEFFNAARLASDVTYWISEGWKLVKVYRPIDGQRPFWDSEITILDVEIGYHEQRLTALERLTVMCKAQKYWDIPF